MIKYATRLPPGKEVQLLDNGLVRKTERMGTQDTYEFMKRVITHFMDCQDPLVVQVFDFHDLGYKKGHWMYSYDMERCGILSVEERAFINHVGDLWDSHGSRACQQDDADLRSYREKFPKLFDFLKEVVEQDRYMDLHSGNVMMSPDYTYVLIDLEGFLKYPFARPSNDWIYT